METLTSILNQASILCHGMKYCFIIIQQIIGSVELGHIPLIHNQYPEIKNDCSFPNRLGEKTSVTTRVNDVCQLIPSVKSLNISVEPSFSLTVTVALYDVLRTALLPLCSWWRHQMETFSALLAICAGNSPVTGEFLAQRPVTRSFYVFFDLGLNERLSKQSWGWWFETPSGPLWRHSNVRGNTYTHPHPHPHTHAHTHYKTILKSARYSLWRETNEILTINTRNMCLSNQS